MLPPPSASGDFNAKQATKVMPVEQLGHDIEWLHNPFPEREVPGARVLDESVIRWISGVVVLGYIQNDCKILNHILC